MLKVGIQESDIIETFFETNPEYEVRVKIKKIKVILSEEQRRELLSVAYEQNYKHGLMIETQLGTGMRINELVNLSIPQINFVSRTIEISSRTGNKYVSAFKTKTLSSNRIIPISRDLAHSLKSFIGTRKNGYVFESRKGGHIDKTSAIRNINRYAKQCRTIGRNIGSHALRRTYASYLLQNQIAIADISKLLGHSSIKTTMRYLFDIEPIDEESIRKVLNKMNKRK